MEYFDYPAGAGDHTASSLSWDRIRDLLEQSDEQGRQRLRNELERVEEQLQHRDDLYQQAVARIRSEIDR